MVSGQPGVGPVSAQRAQGRQQILAGVIGVGGCGDGRPVGVLGAGGGQAVGHIGHIQVGMIDQVLV